MSGRPVVGSEIGGIPELIKIGEAGLLFEPRSVDDLAEKISWVISNPNELQKMGKRARDMVEEKYGPEIHYEKVMDIYKRSLKNIIKKK